MHPNDDDAAKFAGYMAGTLSRVGHWDTGDFETAEGSFWALYPGVTVIARNQSEFDDKNSPAFRLIAAIGSIGIKVHKKEVPTLSPSDDVGMWVGKCEPGAGPPSHNHS